MAKFHLDRLKKKYENIPVKGKTYEALMTEVISHNSERVSRKILKVDEDNWNRALKKITPKEKTFVVPDVSEVLPKQSVFVRKAAEQGDLMRDTLRDELNKNLRETLDTFTEKTKEATYIRRRGVGAGKINEKLIKQFEQNITTTFQGYTKKDPKFGMPTNIHTIAVTEMRSTINNIQYDYVDKLISDNEDIEFNKTWKQNKRMAKEPRRGHDEVDNIKIPMRDLFQVPRYKKIRGKWARIGTTMMRYPHDPNAPPDQVIG
jgi:hypothetical protein